MSTALAPSPDLLAVDLLRMQMESMPAEDLQEHIDALRAVLVALVESRHLRPHISLTAAANLDRLIRKLQAKLPYALDLLCSLRVTAAWLDAARQAESEKAGSECRPSRLDA
ncbi:hypothetical protein RAMLITH_18060 [Ramlibacter sp. RBP-2]|uniref:Uncharacterized protein n=1 Tax=Ramlibacter lithotrophicus TaxID=2606681 RepID=A0A7X6DIF4_9BURK|nr:hypothetical protein [Ramlibacter lithotrophicus]NKE67729.1 hypothetical protein [Ramlibacter lithotrophicus]